jgi:hypothetical protein
MNLSITDYHRIDNILSDVLTLEASLWLRVFGENPFRFTPLRYNNAECNHWRYLVHGFVENDFFLASDHIRITDGDTIKMRHLFSLRRPPKEGILLYRE